MQNFEFFDSLASYQHFSTISLATTFYEPLLNYFLDSPDSSRTILS